MTSISNTDKTSSRAIVLFCGLPGSGKTTLIQSLCVLWNQDYPTVVVKSCTMDELSVKEGQSFDPEVWKSARAESRCFVRESLQQQNQRCLVFIDDTVFYRSMRKEYFQIATSMNSAFVLVYLKCPLEICLDRNTSRGAATVPEWVLRKTAGQFEPPDGDKAYWEQDTIVIDSSQSDFRNLQSCKTVADRIMNNWTVAQKKGTTEDIRLQQKINGQRINQQNSTHQLDLQFRSIITQRLTQMRIEYAGSDLSVIARSFNRVRLEALSLFKSRCKWIENIEEFKTEIHDAFVNNMDLELQQWIS